MKPNFKILDGLRGIAATYVLIHHSRGNLLMGGSEYAKTIPIEQWTIFDKFYYSILQLTSLGREFVILFFILSGFSIAYSLQKKSPILEFYRRRLIRLYPPYILALIWAAFVYFISKQISPIFTEGEISVFGSLSNIISNLLYIPNGAFIGQFWSLTYEVIFYLIIPICILNRRVYFIVSALIYIVSICYSWQQTSGTSIPAMYILDYNVFFAIGIWMFHNYEKVASIFVIKKKAVFYCVSIMFCLLMIIVKFKLGEFNKLTLALAVIFSILLITNFLQKEINNKALSFLGTMSYTLYITHMATIYIFKSFLFKIGFMNSVNITAWYIWIIGVFISIGASYLFFYMAEYPSKIILKNSAKNHV